jgi:multidrug efflux system membrane fusion protein
VQRGPNGTFVYVIGANDTVTARSVTVTQQNDTDAVIASGLETSERVVTTGFANLAEGARVTVGTADNLPTLDNAPQRRRGPGGAQKQNQKGPGQGQGQGQGGGQAAPKGPPSGGPQGGGPRP